MAKAIGIDLGTYNSAASVALGRTRVAMIESKYGKTLYGKSFPSFVLFDHYGRVQLAGQRAKEELRLNPELVIWGVKRLVGLSYQAALAQGEFRRFQYHIEEGPQGDILIRVGEERLAPSHILEIILREIKEDAENPKVNPLLGGVVDSTLKAANVRPALQVVEREFGLLEIHGAGQAEVLAAGEAVLDHLGLTEADRARPRVAGSQFITNVDPYQAQLINKWRKGNLLIPGSTLHILEVAPAAYVTLAANEAEKAADINLIEVRALGRFGRLFISGTESDVAAAASAAVAALEELEGTAT